MQGQQVEPDMSPLTRHDFSTLATALKLQCDNKIEQLKKTTFFLDDSTREQMAEWHKILILNDEDSRKNIREIIQKDNVQEARVQEAMERLKKLENSQHRTRHVTEPDLLKKIEHVEDKFALYAQREIEKQMDEKEKKQGSTWNRVKKMMSKDGIENKYIVD